MVFQKGQSGNPSGKPAVERIQLLKKLKESGLIDEAIKVLGEELKTGRKNRFESAKWILEQLIGKAPQSVALTDPDGEALKVNFVIPPQGLFNGNKPD